MSESSGIALYNFEDNSLSSWTITEEGTCDMAVSSSAKSHGSYGCRFNFDGTNNECHGYRSFTAGADIYARCYFYIPSSFSGSVSTLNILSLDYSTSALAVRPVFYIQSGGNIVLYRLYYYTNSASIYQDLTQTVITRDAWHHVEVRHKTGNGDGIASMYYDGNLITEISGLTNNNYQAGYVRIGNIRASVPTSGSYFDVDDVKINSSYIGAYAEESTTNYIPGIVNNYKQQGLM